METLGILIGMVIVFGGFFLLFAAVVGTIAWWRQGDLEQKLRTLEFDLAKLRSEVDVVTRRAADRPAVGSEPAAHAAAETASRSTIADVVAEAATASNELAASAAAADGPVSISTPVDPASVPEAPPKIGFEQRLGANWTVWAGGLALALGAVFLVRYSIERGLIGPPMRIALGALAAMSLGILGEWLRRRQQRADLPSHPIADIPAVLTGAGVIAAFATAYAAFALYQFLGPVSAFLLLAAIALAALALSALHGSWIAALGLVGSYATPALVGGETPNAWALFGYLAFVTAANYLLAYLRGWLWLAIAATAAAIAWALLWFAGTYEAEHSVPLALYVAVLTILALMFLGSGDDVLARVLGPPAARTVSPFGGSVPNVVSAEPAASRVVGFDWPLIGILGGLAVLAFAFVRMDGFGQASLALLAVMTVLLLGAAARQMSLVPLAALAALLFLACYVGWHLPAVLPDGAVTFSANAARSVYAPPALQSFLVVGAVFAIGFAVAGFAVLTGPRPHEIWAGMLALTPLAILAYAHWRGIDFTKSVPFASAALLLAVAYAAMTEVLNRRGGDARIDWSVGALAAATAAALALAATMVLERGWLTIALSLLAPALAWIALQRPIPILRAATAVVALIVVGRFFWDPRIAGEAVGATPIFNWLLYGYGVPAVAFFLAARWLRQRQDDRYVAAAEGAALAFGTALVSLQLRHLVNGGDVFAGRFTLFEAGLQTAAAFALAIGLDAAHRFRGRPMYLYGAQALTALGLLSGLFVLLLSRNPVFTNVLIGGGSVFNDLLMAYALPAVLAGLLYWRLRNQSESAGFTAHLPPRLASRVVGGAAIVLGFAYLSLQTMRIEQGPLLSLGRMTEELSYALSAVWLVFAITLLGAGILFRAAPLRHAAFAVLLIVVLKVFLLDMAGLTGLLRALSFLGLGLVLVGIGYAYQKLVFHRNRRRGM